MRRMGLLLFALASVWAWPSIARATSYSDSLARCLIRATTPADQKTVVRWAFATMALDPDVASMADIAPARREAIDRQAGALVTDLLAQSCRQPVEQALAFEGPSAVQVAFEAWGRWAVAGVMSEPHVARGMSALLQYIDIGKLMSLMPLQGFPPGGGTH